MSYFGVLEYYCATVILYDTDVVVKMQVVCAVMLCH
jgi:hypothetical protein